MNTFYTDSRQEWRAWLASHFETEKEIYLVFPMKASHERRLCYNDAVEEALCFGWIDSTIKNIDPLRRAQRFVPRKAGSSYSRPNIERLLWLEQHNMIHPSIRETVLPLLRAPYAFPQDILDKVREDSLAWKHYENFPDAYKRIRIAYIDAARKRPEEFQKRMRNFIAKTRANKMFGYGGIDKYFK